MKIKITLILLASIALLGAIMLMAFFRHGTTLSGYVSSYSAYPHDEWDVLDFVNGKVVLRTCCGDEPWGTFGQEKGKWIWHLERKIPGWKQDFIVEPRWASIKFTGKKDPSISFSLRRRLFQKLPL